ncbi:hypothetical protein ACFL9T_06225 [Thermodesulfobacteriota bacterium]
MAALHFTRNSANRDGSGNDYYPFERAFGATAFSLYSCTEAYLRMGFNDDKLVRFFCRRARWIADHDEPGEIANHQAAAALSLYNVYLITQDSFYRDLAKVNIEKTLSMQSEEGWFKEYDGCDPGYNTWTIDFLAKYYQKSRDETLMPVLDLSVKFAKYFLHPDGSYGGTYGSRDTCNFFPHGFEILTKKFSEATWICDRYLQGILRGKQGKWNDDRTFGHHLENYLLAYLDFHEEATAVENEEVNFQKYFPQAGIIVSSRDEYYLVLSLKKGGSFRLFREKECIHSETGYIGRTGDGCIVVTNMIDDRAIEVNDGNAKVKGHFHQVKYLYSSSLKLVLFRLALLTLGRFSVTSLKLKALLQKLLIVDKHQVPIAYERVFDWQDGLTVQDRIYRTKKINLKSLAIGTEYTASYTAISDAYQETRLNPWIDISNCAPEFNLDGELAVKRHFK